MNCLKRLPWSAGAYKDTKWYYPQDRVYCEGSVYVSLVKQIGNKPSFTVNSDGTYTVAKGWILLAPGILDKGENIDYPSLTGKPSINGVVLEGDKTPEELGMYSKRDTDEKFETKSHAAEADKRVQGMLDGKVDKIPGKGLSANDLTDERAGKVDMLETGGRANEHLNGAGKYSRPVRQGYGVSVAEDNTVSVDAQVIARQSDVASVAADLAAQKAKEQEISNTYRSDNVLNPGGTFAGQVLTATGIFNASTNYVNRYYPVVGGKRVNITGTITRTLSAIAFAAFFPGSSLPVQNDVLTVINSISPGAVDVSFTPQSNGYLLIMYTINNSPVASDVVVKQLGNYIDFQSEIDAANVQIGLNRSGLASLENKVEPLFIDTQENENYDGRFYAYINANNGIINAQAESSGRAVRYYRALAGSKYTIKANNSSGNAIYTFLAFFAGDVPPVPGNTVTVIIPYTASGLAVNYEYTAPSNGYILLGFWSSQFEMQLSFIGTWAILDKTAIDMGAQIVLPSKIVSVVGDTIQVFKRSIIKAITPEIYDLQADCPIGADYPRYFELTPVAGNIGTKTLKFSLRNFAAQSFDEKSCSLIVHTAPSDPGSMKRIAVFGDSLTQGGQWVVEAARRLLSNDAATPTMPAGNGLTNIKFIGAMGDGNARYYGVGGWSWKNYTEAGAPAFRFQVTGVSTIVKGAIYSNNNHQYTIVENNTTGGVGNILCETGSGSYTPQSSGVLTKVSGNGDATITFTSAAADAKNPLWDNVNNRISFTKYVSNIGESSLDCVVFLLGWNTIGDVIDGFVNQRTYIETLLSALHTQYPSAKVKIMGLQLPSLNGGLGANYGASGTYSEKFNIIRSVLAYNKFLENLCAESAYNSFVEYVDVMTQFDSENNMPESATQVNTRNAKTEERGTNGVHPAQPGYLQIADVIYRCIVNNYC